MNPTPASVAREAGHRARQIRRLQGEELRRIRLDAGVSLTRVATHAGISAAHLSRIEAGTANPSIDVLTAIAVALGADLRIRYFAGSGPRLHDRFQAPIVEALIGALDPRWRVELEVPVSQPSRGVIDVVLHDRGGSVVVACEVASEIRRLEQQVRWMAEKAAGLQAAYEREGLGAPRPPVSQLLVLRSTIATRDLARRYEATFGAAFPARSHDAYLALTTQAASWPGVAIVWAHQRGSHVRLLATPPPRIRVGR